MHKFEIEMKLGGGAECARVDDNNIGQGQPAKEAECTQRRLVIQCTAVHRGFISAAQREEDSEVSPSSRATGRRQQHVRAANRPTCNTKPTKQPTRRDEKHMLCCRPGRARHGPRHGPLLLRIDRGSSVSDLAGLGEPPLDPHPAVSAGLARLVPDLLAEPVRKQEQRELAT
jgi:hypothetical protein